MPPVSETIAAVILKIPGMEITDSGKFTCNGESVGEVSTVGDSVIFEVKSHPLDAAALVEHYACCTAIPESAEFGAGWVQFMFLADPGVEEIEALLEACHSACTLIQNGN